MVAGRTILCIYSLIWDGLTALFGMRKSLTSSTKTILLAVFWTGSKWAISIMPARSQQSNCGLTTQCRMLLDEISCKVNGLSNCYSLRMTSLGGLQEIEQEGKAEQLKTESLRGGMVTEVKFRKETSCCKKYSFLSEIIAWFTHFSDNRDTLRRSFKVST